MNTYPPKRPIVVYFTTRDGTYGIDENINIRVNATYGLAGTSVHQVLRQTVLVMETGEVDRNAVMSRGGVLQSTLYYLTYRYTVQENDTSTDLNYASRDALHWTSPTSYDTLQDTTAQSAAHNCYLPPLDHPDSLAGRSNIIIDGIRPLLHNVTALVANGTYGAGRDLSFNATFSEPVFVVQGSEPKLNLNFDGTYRNATYASGNETRSLVFEYTVQSGDETSRLDYNATNALLGDVRDVAKNLVNWTRVAAPGEPSSLGRTSEIATETVQPEVASVSLLGADRAYGLGETIRINVTFTEPVRVVTTGGTPTLPLNTTGGTPSAAEYHSGTGSASLEFRYTVGAEQEAASLDHGSPLSLNAGTIKDVAGNDAVLDVSGLTGSDRLAASPSLSVDGKRPAVTGVASPNASNTYGPTSIINIAVTFDEDVTVTGTPRIKLETGSTDKYAVHGAGQTSAARTHSFTYTVASGDESADLDYHTDAVIELSGGATIEDSVGNDARLTLPAPGSDGLLAGQNDRLVVDGRAPEVLSVASPNASNTYGPTSIINIAVTFDEDVTVTGTPRIKLETGTTDRYANYTAPASTATVLAFTYQVAPGDVSADLDYHTDAVIELNGGTIRDDPAGNNAVLSLPAPGTDGLLSGQANRLVVDGVRPAVVSVSSPNGTGTYYPNDLIHVHVRFNETVTATGAPFVELNATGGDPARATYLPGSPGENLTFVYSVGPNNVAGTLDYDGAGALKLGGGSIVDLAGNTARLALPGPGAPGSDLAASRIKVVGDIPSVARVSSPDADGAYGTGARINVTVTFSEAVSVDGSAPPPYIALNAGEGARATHVPGAGAGAGENLSFAYVVRPGDNTDLLAHVGPLMDAGAIANVDDEPVHTTLPSPGLPTSLSGSSSISIDTAAPAVERVWSPNRTGTYTAGDAIRIVVVFSENVTVDASSGVPSLTLETGDTDRQATYESGSGTRALAFAYIVSAGDDSGGRPLDYTGTSALSLNGGSIRDVAGNDAGLSLPEPGQAGSLAESGIAVDAAPPYVEHVASTNVSATYGAGEEIGIAVVFSEAVAYAGTAPSLALNAGGDSPAVAAYTSGNGTATLSFSYEVRIGDRTDDLSYNGTGALSGTMADLAGNPANLTLPAPGTAGSLSASSSIILLGLAGPVAASADASFTGPNTVRIEYDRPLGLPAGNAGPAYGAITIGVGDAATTAQPAAGGESGLGTSVHTVRFGGPGAGAGQNGSIALNADLVFAVGSARYEFTDDSINVRAGDTARTLSPRGGSPVVAIESGGFVRAVNATAAGEGARPALNVSGLAALPDSGGRVAIIASFAEVSFPPGVAVPDVPGGLLELYVYPQKPPTPEAVAAAFGASDGTGITVLRVVEVGGNENGTRIAFEMPVRILLAGQANGSAFYLGANGTVVPIARMCDADDTDAVHRQLDRAGACEIDSGADKVIYTYHLTPFGTARGPDGGAVMPDCSISVKPRIIEFVDELRPGMQSNPVSQTVSGAGSMPLSEVSISADDWKVEGAATVVMPANATSVLPRDGGEWMPMNGEVGLPLAGGQADLQFRLAVPPGTAPVAETLQIVTYTASCAEGAP